MRWRPFLLWSVAGTLAACLVSGCDGLRQSCAEDPGSCPSGEVCIAEGRDARVPGFLAPLLDPAAQCWPACGADGGCPGDLVCHTCLASGECPVCRVCVSACHPR